MPLMSVSIESLKIELEKMNKKLDTLTENDRIFRYNLEVAISKIRESNGNIADTLDKLLDDWNNL